MPATPLVRPTDFFEGRDGDGLLTPAILVWVSSVLLIGSVVLATDPGYDATPVQLVSAIAFAGVVGGLVAWGFVAILVYVASIVLGGKGSGFWGTLAALGWGYLPMVVGGVVDVTAAMFLSETTITATEPFADPMSFLFGAVGVGFVLWQGYVWFAAVKHVRGLDTRRAILAVAIPVALPLLAWAV